MYFHSNVDRASDNLLILIFCLFAFWFVCVSATAPTSTAATTIVTLILPLVNDVLYFLPFAIQFGLFVFLSFVFPRLSPVLHFNAVLECGLGQRLLRAHVIRILFLCIEIPSANRALFVAQIHFRVVDLVIGVVNGIVHFL